MSATHALASRRASLLYFCLHAPEVTEMKKLLMLLVGFPWAVGATTASDNYIFNASQPLVIVTQKGEFAPFGGSELGNVGDQTGREIIDKRMAKRVQQLWRYSESGSPERVSAIIKADYVGCDRSLVVQTEGGDSGVLYSTRPIRSIPFSLADADLKRARDEGRRLLSDALRHRKVTSDWIAELLEGATVTPVRVRAWRSPMLVVTTNGERKERTLSAFLIASLAKDGRYALLEKTVEIGSASDSEGYAGTWDLGLHVDLNGDGDEELLMFHGAYESFSAVLMQWDGKKWREVASNGGGC